METEEAILNETQALTQRIKERQSEIGVLSDMRRHAVIRARGAGITYRRIAESMDVTEQIVYKIMREARAAHEIKESA